MPDGGRNNEVMLFKEPTAGGCNLTLSMTTETNKIRKQLLEWTPCSEEPLEPKTLKIRDYKALVQENCFDLLLMLIWVLFKK